MKNQKFRGVSIIIPVYNEAATLPVLLDAVEKIDLSSLGLQKEIVVIDDASNDGTEKFLSEYKSPAVKIVKHGKNQGKGAAIQTGLKLAEQDIVLIQDADLEYNPEEYPILLKPILMGAADAVYGSRFVGSSPHRIMYFWHYMGNKLITFLTNIFANLNLTDIETGFKVFTREAINSIQLKEKRFGIEPELTIKLGKKRWRFYEVGVSYFGRGYAEGKKIRWTDGISALIKIFKYGLFS
ncbi:MAG: glycosyltransferase family 2 protein [Patescibacteria group bacterium]